MDEILTTIITDKDLSRLVSDVTPKVLSNPVPENPLELLYKNVFPYPYVPDIQDEVNSYITVVFDDFRPENSEIKTNRIIFNVFCHESIIKIRGGSRLFYMYEALDKLFNGKQMGIGKLNFIGGDLLGIKKPHTGHYFAYEITDFNKAPISVCKKQQ